ncbi:MAG: hypothetical protein Q8P37_00135 [Candidatus Spechtbacteria bacterium]|uniref:Uncharacterized protein n=1 Tax=Candidatus Spechtbacteria bacterium RIFCSPLOWO2_01_FULL_43_12 TaxID=1802162 RepID=A0A1G2HEP8_9BACT|nr:hypothetical protein [Candidatus Spechtbacteria bacterium]OGZ60859.1 MAG: hypothetical protein A2919_02310 [Candidatus Spechtbacteria bacterium RIFCSPLOWO2_01_FULL_43_12]
MARAVNPRDIRRFRDELQKEQMKLEDADKELQRLRSELLQVEMDLSTARRRQGQLNMEIRRKSLEKGNIERNALRNKRELDELTRTLREGEFK